MADTQKNYSEQLLTLTNKIKAFEELAQKTTAEKASIHLTEVTNLKDQIKDLTQQYQNQICQLNLLTSDKTKSLNEQIENLKDQQLQKDEMIKQANNLATSYQHELKKAQRRSGINVIAVLIAIIIGFILGAFIFSRI